MTQTIFSLCLRSRGSSGYKSDEEKVHVDVLRSCQTPVTGYKGYCCDVPGRRKVLSRPVFIAVRQVKSDDWTLLQCINSSNYLALSYHSLRNLIHDNPEKLRVLMVSGFRLQILRSMS